MTKKIFAAGCWAATVLAIFWIDRVIAGKADLENLLSGLQKEIFFVGLVCVGIVILAGMGRTFLPMPRPAAFTARMPNH